METAFVVFIVCSPKESLEVRNLWWIALTEYSVEMGFSSQKGIPSGAQDSIWVGKIPWSRKWQPTPVFLPGKSHGQRNLAGYSPWGSKELDTIERLSTPTHIIQKIKCSQQCKQWPENGKKKPRIF